MSQLFCTTTVILLVRIIRVFNQTFDLYPQPVQIQVSLESDIQHPYSYPLTALLTIRPRVAIGRSHPACLSPGKRGQLR
jgi:hypothetical protein